MAAVIVVVAVSLLLLLLLVLLLLLLPLLVLLTVGFGGTKGTAFLLGVSMRPALGGDSGEGGKKSTGYCEIYYNQSYRYRIIGNCKRRQIYLNLWP